jgi:hypothetical protein
MSLMGNRYEELREQDARRWQIRLRIEKRYKRLRSFSPAMRRHFAERDIRAAMVEAGLPLPAQLSFGEMVQRHVQWARRDPSHVKRISDLSLRRAVISVLEDQ